MPNKLPAPYIFLESEPGPKMLLEALKWHGTREAVGEADNPVILAWASELKMREYRSDATAWCGLFMAFVAKRSGKPLPASPLWARAWLEWGIMSATPKLGDVLVFWRKGGGGHVGLYVGEDATYYHVLGGNQGDAVSVVRIDKKRLLGARDCYKKQPENCRPVWLSAAGPTSTNEA